MDHVVAAGAAECPGVHHAAADCPGTVPVCKGISAWRGRHANRKTHQLRAWDADATAGWQAYSNANHKTNSHANAQTRRNTHANACINTNANTGINSDSNTDTNRNPGPDADADSGDACVQSRVRHRHGKRGVDQPDR